MNGQSSRAIDNGCGSSDDLLPTPTLDICHLHYWGLGHDIIYFPPFLSVSVPNEKKLKKNILFSSYCELNLIFLFVCLFVCLSFCLLSVALG